MSTSFCSKLICGDSINFNIYTNFNNILSDIVIVRIIIYCFQIKTLDLLSYY